MSQGQRQSQRVNVKSQARSTSGNVSQRSVNATLESGAKVSEPFAFISLGSRLGQRTDEDLGRRLSLVEQAREEDDQHHDQVALAGAEHAVDKADGVPRRLREPGTGGQRWLVSFFLRAGDKRAGTSSAVSAAPLPGPRSG